MISSCRKKPFQMSGLQRVQSKPDENITMLHELARVHVRVRRDHSFVATTPGPSTLNSPVSASFQEDPSVANRTLRLSAIEAAAVFGFGSAV